MPQNFAVLEIYIIFAVANAVPARAQYGVIPISENRKHTISMEKMNPTPEQVEASEDILAKARANKKTIVWCLVAGFVVIIGVLVWLMVAQAGSKKGRRAYCKGRRRTRRLSGSRSLCRRCRSRIQERKPRKSRNGHTPLP